MIPFRAIRSAIVQNLAKHLELEFIELNGGGDIPTGAFFAYDISDLDDGTTPEIRQVVGQEDRQITGAAFTATFLSYADDKATSIENALRARDWFRTDGYQILKDINVIVYEMTPVENRDIQIGVEWERRQGFDVELRTKSTASMPAQWIETVNLQRSE